MHESGRERPQPEGGREGRGPQDRRRLVKLVAGLIVAALLLVFILQNREEVPVEFVFFGSRVRLVWALLTSAILGGLASFLLGRPRRKAMKRLIEELEKKRKED